MSVGVIALINLHHYPVPVACLLALFCDQDLTLSYVNDLTILYSRDEPDDSGFRAAMLAALPACFPRLQRLHFETSNDKEAYMSVYSSERFPPFFFAHLRSLSLPPLCISDDKLKAIF